MRWVIRCRQESGAEKRRPGALSGGHIAFGDGDAGVPDGPSATDAERGVQHGAETQGEHRPELPLHAAATLVREAAAGRPDSVQAAVGQLDGLVDVQLPEPAVDGRPEPGQRHRIRPMDSRYRRMRNV
ncbi:unnamed protein product [Macrosiphum euphorbiae]|uniref:Uncharacterized protein n=1 Tax=Macrosiphum euphorbiae TaxID=13131 RepID=A0AAV0VLQ8_9HEMI|nr:unnamed protein product [Macrosiphum euphorbiae]